jgi:hypothetical protein
MEEDIATMAVEAGATGDRNLVVFPCVFDSFE